MDKILITYRGGYGDIYSILSAYSLNKSYKITFLVEKEHEFLKNLYPWVNFVKNPIYQLYDKKIYNEKINEHIKIKESIDFDQLTYDQSVIEVAFYIWSQYQPYVDFYKKLILEHDLTITNYLDLTAIKVCQEVNKEWWQVRSWYKWPKEHFYLNLFNQYSKYKNIYYYEKDWIKGFETDPNGFYSYTDADFYKKGVDILKEKFNLSFKTKNKKVFFATLGSMSKYNSRIGKNIMSLYLKKINDLMQNGWYGITTEYEYSNFLKKNTQENWLYVLPEWYPHDIVFDYIQLFLTHGGAGSFARAIYKNKKMIVFPFQLDQFYFGKIAENYYEGEMIV